MTLEKILERLKKVSIPSDLEGMARVGITPDKAFGTKIPELRKLAKEIGKNHELAQELWDAGYRETQILAGMIDEPKKVTGEQMDRWAKDFVYWEICDQCCMNLFYQLPEAAAKAKYWSEQEGEQIKRAGFALMAVMVWKVKNMDIETIKAFYPFIKKGAVDPRGPVKKAVSWALKHIGKRNRILNHEAIAWAREIGGMDSKAAQWIAKDALKELTDSKLITKLEKKQ